MSQPEPAQNDDPILEQFLLEARTQLQQASDQLLVLEENPEDLSQVDFLFRAVHTVKGGAGLFDAPGFNRLLHESEQVLQNLRDGSLVVGSETVDALLAALDHAMDWVAQMGAEAQVEGEWEAELPALLEALQTIKGDPADNLSDGGGAEADFQAEAFSLQVLQRVFRESMSKAPEALAWLRFAPAADCLFLGQDPVNDIAGLPGLLALGCEGASAQTADFDPYKHHLTYHALVTSSRTDCLGHLQGYEGQVQWTSIHPLSLVKISGEAQPIAAQSEIVNQFQTALAASDVTAFNQVVEAGLELGGEGRRLHAVLSWLALLEDWGELNDRRRQALVSSIDAGQPELVTSDSQTQATQVEATDSSESPGFGFFDQDLEDAPDEGLSGKEDTDGFGFFEEAPGLTADSETDQGQIGSRPESDTPAKGSEPEMRASTRGARDRQREHIHVKLEHLDRLGELVGELIVARNGLPYLARRAESDGGRDLSRAIKEQGKLLERVTQNIQRTVSAVQMQPVATTFQRFRRLVRDISQKLDKSVNLNLEGEETEADRQVLDAIIDPLTHLVRNAMDHGLESPQQRRELGKDEIGQLTLRARYSGEYLSIEVIDDGGGIDPDRVAARAFEKGLVSEEALDRMSAADKQALIFAPGFSTAETVSQVSGRGVGMDAVQDVVNSLGGRVEIDSRVGEGSRFSLILPLSMAVSRLLLVRLGGQDLGLPMGSVREIVRLPPDAIQAVHHQQVIQVRERVVPVVCLRERLALPESHDHSSHVATFVIVRGLGQGPIALRVDDVEEDMEVVVKPLEGVLAGNQAFSGSALLGDGRILLAVDLQGVMS